MSNIAHHMDNYDKTANSMGRLITAELGETIKPNTTYYGTACNLSGTRTCLRDYTGILTIKSAASPSDGLTENYTVVKQEYSRTGVDWWTKPTIFKTRQECIEFHDKMILTLAEDSSANETQKKVMYKKVRDKSLIPRGEEENVREWVNGMNGTEKRYAQWLLDNPKFKI